MATRSRAAAADAPVRVLMFGWEFPPHLSGGLGTACHGLTRGLSDAGIPVLFVLPRLLGGEDDRHVRLLGAESAPGYDAGARGVALLAFDSPLSPYLDDAGYRARARRRSRHAEGARPAPLDLRGDRRVVAKRDAGCNPYAGDLQAEVARYARAAGELARTEEFDIIHAHDWMAFPAGMEAARVSGRPLVVHVHATEQDRNGDTPDWRIAEVERRGLEAADRVVAVSRYTARGLRRAYGIDAAKVRVVHNAAAHRLRARRRARRSLDRPPTVLFLGRVTGQKDPETFLRAARLVATARPDARFVVAGGGDLLPAMVERAAAMGLGDRVHFTGFLRGPEVARVYRMADLFVLPSRSEPFGIAPLEALAHGVPAVLSRRSGVSEVLPSAPRVPPGNAAALARAILPLLADPRRRRDLLRRQQADAEALDWRAQARQLARVYEELVA